MNSYDWLETRPEILVNWSDDMDDSDSIGCPCPACKKESLQILPVEPKEPKLKQGRKFR